MNKLKTLDSGLKWSLSWAFHIQLLSPVKRDLELSNQTDLNYVSDVRLTVS